MAGLTVEGSEAAQPALYVGCWFVDLRPDHHTVVEDDGRVGHAAHFQGIPS